MKKTKLLVICVLCTYLLIQFEDWPLYLWVDIYFDKLQHSSSYTSTSKRPFDAELPYIWIYYGTFDAITNKIITL